MSVKMRHIKSREPDKTMERLMSFLKSDLCNLNALKVLAVIESTYNKRRIFDSKFFNLLELLPRVKNLKLETLLNVTDPDIKKIVDNYINDFHKKDKNGNIIYPTDIISYSIQNGLMATASCLADFEKKNVRDLYYADIDFRMAENVMIVWYKKTYKLTFLINELNCQLLSVFNKNTKKVIHFSKQIFSDQNSIHNYLDKLDDYIDYTQEIFEMVEI